MKNIPLHEQGGVRQRGICHRRGAEYSPERWTNRLGKGITGGTYQVNQYPDFGRLKDSDSMVTAHDTAIKPVATQMHHGKGPVAGRTRNKSGDTLGAGTNEIRGKREGR